MNNDLETSLKRSIEQYQGIKDEMSTVLNDLDKEDSAAMKAFVGRLNTLQTEAAKIDEAVLEALKGGDAEVAKHPLYLKRLQLIEKIVEQNRLISSQAHGIMAVVSAELSQLRDGRAAVSGYAPNQETRGKRVREAC